MKRALILIVGIAVSAICFALSLKNTSGSDLKAGFAQANYWTLPLMLFLLGSFYWLKTMRWAWLLSPVSTLSTRQLFAPMLIGFAANNVLPAHLGEFVRVFVVWRKFGVPAAAVLSTVVLERIFDVLAILTLFAVGIAYSGDLPEDLRIAAILLGTVFGGIAVAVVVYLIWTEWFLNLTQAICSRLSFLPHSLTEKILGILRNGAAGLASLRSGRMVLAITVSSMVQWLMNGLIAYLALRSFGIPVTPATGFLVTGVTAFAVMIPSTPGYFGVIQLAFQFSMSTQLTKPDPSLVLGASLYYHISMYIPVTLLGLWYLQKSGLHLKDLQRAADTAGEAVDEVISDAGSESPATAVVSDAK